MNYYKKKNFVTKRYTLFVVYIVALLLFSGIFFWQYVPYQNFASKQIISILKSRNIAVVSLQVEKADSSQIILSNIKLEGSNGLSLGGLKATYNIQEIISGKLSTIDAENIDGNIYKKEGKFLINGLEDFLLNDSKDSKIVKVPTDNNLLQEIAPQYVSIKSFNISAKDNDIELLIPLNFTFSFSPLATLKMDSSGASLKVGSYQIETGGINFNAVLSESDKWQGDIAISSIKIGGLEEERPPLAMTGNFVLDAASLLANIVIKDAGNITKADMVMSLPVADPSSGSLNIKNIQFPWGGGLISSESINVPLDMKTPVLLNINLKEVDLSDTLGKASNGRIKGTGKISGRFPVIYNPDGTILLKDGMAEEINSGTISVSPDLLPGDNAQLALARSLLENFHYTKLKIIVSSKGDKSAINLELEGKNPDSQEDRPIKFNINLTGDILPLIQQSIIPFNDIKELLKQEKP